MKAELSVISKMKMCLKLLSRVGIFLMSAGEEFQSPAPATCLHRHHHHRLIIIIMNIYTVKSTSRRVFVEAMQIRRHVSARHSCVWRTVQQKGTTDKSFSADDHSIIATRT